jgi:hypothetical protein
VIDVSNTKSKTISRAAEITDPGTAYPEEEIDMKGLI